MIGNTLGSFQDQPLTFISGLTYPWIDLWPFLQDWPTPGLTYVLLEWPSEKNAVCYRKCIEHVAPTLCCMELIFLLSHGSDVEETRLLSRIKLSWKCVHLDLWGENDQIILRMQKAHLQLQSINLVEWFAGNLPEKWYYEFSMSCHGTDCYELSLNICYTFKIQTILICWVLHAFTYIIIEEEKDRIMVGTFSFSAVFVCTAFNVMKVTNCRAIW